MSEPRDPRRLELEAAPELKQMIDALRSDGPSSAGMQRMAQKLEPWLDAPAAAPGPGKGGFAGPLGKIGLVVLASGVLIALLPRMFRNSFPEEPTREVAGPADSMARVGEVAVPVSSSKPATERPAQVAQSEEKRGVASPAPTDPARGVRPGIPKHTARARSAGSPAASRHAPDRDATGIATQRGAETAAASPESSSPAVSATPGAVVEDRAATVATGTTPAPLSATARARGSAQPEPASDAVVSEWNEATFLERARRLARERPTQALRLLAEHERRFAHGMLAPEREVLAIEILRAQSRNAEANVRLRAFRQHYPGSVYLQRLDHPAGRP